MTPLSRWEHRVEALGPAADWLRIPVDLDFDAAVSLVIAVDGEPPRLPASKEDHIWSYCHEAAVSWIVQDSLTGRAWHEVASGQLVHGSVGNVARVSAPIGTQVRILLWRAVMVADVRHDSKQVQKRVPCVAPDCDVDHDALKVGLDLGVVVRSI